MVNGTAKQRLLRALERGEGLTARMLVLHALERGYWALALRMALRQALIDLRWTFMPKRAMRMAREHAQAIQIARQRRRRHER